MKKKIKSKNIIETYKVKIDGKNFLYFKKGLYRYKDGLFTLITPVNPKYLDIGKVFLLFYPKPVTYQGTVYMPIKRFPCFLSKKKNPLFGISIRDLEVSFCRKANKEIRELFLEVYTILFPKKIPPKKNLTFKEAFKITAFLEKAGIYREGNELYGKRKIYETD